MSRRGITSGVLVVAIGWAGVGCDSEPPPVNAAKKIEDPQIVVPELKPPMKPAQSDESASQLLKEVIAAHTGGHPERLEKLKSCSFTRTGVTDGSGGQPTTWTMSLVWPDRYRVHSEIQMTQDGVALTQTAVFAVSPKGAWRTVGLTRAGQQTQEKREQSTLDPDGVRALKTQMQEDAMQFLFPLADPKTVVMRATDEILNGKEVVGLHVWTSALDYALVSFDKKTKLLTRVVYNGWEAHVNKVKEVVVTEHQEFDGVKLASKLYVKANGRNLADWTKLSVTTDKPIDPKVFDTP